MIQNPLYKLTILAGEKMLQFTLWNHQQRLASRQIDLQNNILERFFPALQRFLVPYPTFWQQLRAIYCLNGPGRFVALRLQITFLKHVALLQPQCQIYVLDHLLFQVAQAKSTFSLITANDKHYYLAQFDNFQLVQHPQLLAKTALAQLQAIHPQSIFVKDFANLQLDRLWLVHQHRFRLVTNWKTLAAFYLNPFSLGTIKVK